MNAPRSSQWYVGADRDGYIHRAWMRRGLPAHAFDGRPHIAIANTASDLAPCNLHLDQVAESVKQGVWEAGGVPMNLPVVSLGETLVRPTAMLWRNMAAMATEEMIRAQPMDSVVLIGACDKTVPALLMGATSADLPAIQLVGGPMLPMAHHGERLGACTDCRRFWAKYRAGEISPRDIEDIEGNLATTAGSCAVMGTASTMTSVAEALGMTLPGCAAIPAPDSRRLRLAEASGRRIVE